MYNILIHRQLHISQMHFCAMFEISGQTLPEFNENFKLIFVKFEFQIPTSRQKSCKT